MVERSYLLPKTVDYSLQAGGKKMQYDIIIIGAGPGGIFSAYELLKSKPELKIGVFEAGAPLNKRKCPIDGKNTGV